MVTTSANGYVCKAFWSIEEDYCIARKSHLCLKISVDKFLWTIKNAHTIRQKKGRKVNDNHFNFIEKVNNI